MKIQSIQNNYQQNEPSFIGLKKIRCGEDFYGEKIPCSQLEKNVIKELKDLAKVNNFFKENDVNAKVIVQSYSGAHIKLYSKPAAKNIFEQIRNFFLVSTIYKVEDNHLCPDDSAFFIAKKLRNIKNNKKDFFSVFKKERRDCLF